MSLQYLQSWCSCGHPATDSRPSGPCGQYCGCDNTPLLTGSARISSGPQAHWDAHAWPSSLQPDREKQTVLIVMCHISASNVFKLTYITLLYAIYGLKPIFCSSECWRLCWKDNSLLMMCRPGANTSIQLVYITKCFVKSFSARCRM